MLERTGGAEGPVLTRAELARAASDDVEAEREIDGVDGTTRLLAERHGSTVVVVGQSLDDRDETLAALAGAFALGAPIAALVVALLGYALAAAGLRPVERMRARAAGVSLEAPAEPLPLPAAHDEIHRLGTTLNEMLDRLRGSYDRERRFVADASHELRTPVAVIKAELEGALRRAPADPDLRESLRAAVDECDRLAQLAEDLLVLARSGDGALAVRPAPLDPAELLERVRTRFSARAAEHGRALRVDAEPGLILDADELRLSQALGNLVDNALRHGAGAITLSARRAGAEVELAVADEGAGPAPELRPRAFERFARGDEARTRGGAGLGLAIVRAIAEAHGGAAELGRGARRARCDCRLRWIQARAHTLAPCQRKEERHEGQAQGRADRHRRDRRARDGRRRDRRRHRRRRRRPRGHGSDKAITGSALDRASQAALKETGGGKVTETEAGDEESYYEVEVTKADGSQVDVQLDRGVQRGRHRRSTMRTAS